MKSYTLDQTAEILQACSQTVKREIDRGNLHGFKVGVEWRVSDKAIEKYMNLIANEYKSENELMLEMELQKVKNERDSLLAIVSEIGSSVFKAQLFQKGDKLESINTRTAVTAAC